MHQDDPDESADSERGLSPSEKLAPQAGARSRTSLGDIIDKISMKISFQPNDNR